MMRPVDESYEMSDPYEYMTPEQFEREFERQEKLLPPPTNVGDTVALATVTVERPVVGYPRVKDGNVEWVDAHTQRYRVKVGEGRSIDDDLAGEAVPEKLYKGVVLDLRSGVRADQIRMWAAAKAQGKPVSFRDLTFGQERIQSALDDGDIPQQTPWSSTQEDSGFAFAEPPVTERAKVLRPAQYLVLRFETSDVQSETPRIDNTEVWVPNRVLPLAIQVMNGDEGGAWYRLPTPDEVLNIEDPEWKPVMSRAEADVWAADSAYPDDVTHVTSKGNLEVLRGVGFDPVAYGHGKAHGLGSYFGTNAETREFYENLSFGDSQTVLLAKVKLSKPIIWQATGPGAKHRFAQPLAHQLFLTALEQSKEPSETKAEVFNSTWEGSTALTEQLRKLGFDGIIIIEEPELTGEVGGSQVVVFDTDQAVVIDEKFEPGVPDIGPLAGHVSHDIDTFEQWFLTFETTPRWGDVYDELYKVVVELSPEERSGWLEALGIELAPGEDLRSSTVADKLVEHYMRAMHQAKRTMLAMEGADNIGLATITVERPVVGYPRVVDGKLQKVRPHFRKMRVLVGEPLETMPDPEPDDFIDLLPDMDNVDWDEMVEEIRGQGIGNCYEASMTMMLQEHIHEFVEPRIVQGSVMGSGGPMAGKRFWHSWLEVDGAELFRPNGESYHVRYAIDFASGNSTVMPAPVYRNLGQADDLMEFDHDETILASIKYQVYGLWRDDEQPGDRYP